MKMEEKYFICDIKEHSNDLSYIEETEKNMPWGKKDASHEFWNKYYLFAKPWAFLENL